MKEKRKLTQEEIEELNDKIVVNPRLGHYGTTYLDIYYDNQLLRSEPL